MVGKDKKDRKEIISLGTPCMYNILYIYFVRCQWTLLPIVIKLEISISHQDLSAIRTLSTFFGSLNASICNPSEIGLKQEKHPFLVYPSGFFFQENVRLYYNNYWDVICATFFYYMLVNYNCRKWTICQLQSPRFVQDVHRYDCSMNY